MCWRTKKYLKYSKLLQGTWFVQINTKSKKYFIVCYIILKIAYFKTLEMLKLTNDRYITLIDSFDKSLKKQIVLQKCHFLFAKIQNLMKNFLSKSNI